MGSTNSQQFVVLFCCRDIDLTFAYTLTKSLFFATKKDDILSQNRVVTPKLPHKTQPWLKKPQPELFYRLAMILTSELLYIWLATLLYVHGVTFDNVVTVFII